MSAAISAYEQYYRDVGLTEYAAVFTRNHEKEFEAQLCAQHLHGLPMLDSPCLRVLEIGCGLGAFTCRLLDLICDQKKDKDQLTEVVCDLVDINASAFDYFQASADRLENCSVMIERRLHMPWQEAQTELLTPAYDLIVANHVFYGCTCDEALAHSILRLLTPSGRALVALITNQSDLLRMRAEASIPNNSAQDFEKTLNGLFCNFTKLLYDSKFRFDLVDHQYLDWFFASGDVAPADRLALVSRFQRQDGESAYIANRAAIFCLAGRSEQVVTNV